MKSNVGKEISEIAIELLKYSVSDEYASQVFELISDDVIDDVITCSGIENGENFSDSDVKFAIGRILLERLERR